MKYELLDVLNYVPDLKKTINAPAGLIQVAGVAPTELQELGGGSHPQPYT